MKISTINRNPDNPGHLPRFNCRVAGLIAGLALLPGCAGNIQRENVPIVQAGEAGEGLPPEQASPQSACVRQVPSEGYPAKSGMLGTCEVVAGDELLRYDFRFEIPGFIAFVVDKIDGSGVDIDLRMEVGMSNHDGNQAPWHVNYGETKTIGARVSGPGAVRDLIQLPDMLIVSARQGGSPDSAILTIRKPDDDSR